MTIRVPGYSAIRIANARAMAAALLVIAAAFAAGCGGHKNEKRQIPASAMYKSAKQALDSGQYKKASKRYEDLIAHYPFGRYTEQGQLELAYAYYKNEQPELALPTVKRFIKTYPTHPNVDYAYYLKGLIDFKRNRGILQDWLNVSPSDRDQHSAREAFNDFSELIEKFPDSRYAPDAHQRMLYLRNNLAYYELHVARHYYTHGAWVAAVNRCKYIVENYQQTPAAGDALVVMIRSYEQLGLKELAQDTQRVLEMNYPDHPFLKPKEKEGFLSRLLPGI